MGCNKTQLVCLRGRSSINPGAPVLVTFLRPKLPLGLAPLPGVRQEIRGRERKSSLLTVRRGKTPIYETGLASFRTNLEGRETFTACLRLPSQRHCFPVQACALSLGLSLTQGLVPSVCRTPSTQHKNQDGFLRSWGCYSWHFSTVMLWISS